MRFGRNDIKKVSLWRRTAFRNKWDVVKGEDGGYKHADKRKIRNWHRQVKLLRLWGNAIQYPNLIYWNKGSHYVDESYRVYPWYGFYGYRAMPHWFLKILLQQLLSAFDNWDAALSAAGQPYDLYIELHEPNNVLTQITCKRTNEFGTETYYYPLAEVQRPFPYERYTIAGCDMHQYVWRLCVEEDIVFEGDVYWRNTSVEKLLARGYYTNETDKGELYYAKKTGDVWMGRKHKDMFPTTPVIERLYPIPAP